MRLFTPASPCLAAAAALLAASAPASAGLAVPASAAVSAALPFAALAPAGLAVPASAAVSAALPFAALASAGLAVPASAAVSAALPFAALAPAGLAVPASAAVPVALPSAAPAPAVPASAAPAAPAVPAVHLTASAAPASPPAAPLPACATPDDSTFPLTTRIHGGPAAYAPGGGHGTWYLDLTNTTSRTCEGVHPVVVLVDAERALKPSQPRLEFYDGARRHPVALEATDEDELIGAFDGEDAGFAGFTVGPGRTLSVKVRLAFAPDAVSNEVTVNAAVVQRRGGDGDWIGQSDDYRFRVEGGESAAARTSEPMTPSVAATPDGTGAGFPFADELAGTGFGRIGTALAAVVLLLGAGSAAVLLGRRRR